MIHFIFLKFSNCKQWDLVLTFKKRFFLDFCSYCFPRKYYDDLLFQDRSWEIFFIESNSEWNPGYPILKFTAKIEIIFIQLAINICGFLTLQ